MKVIKIEMILRKDDTQLVQRYSTYVMLNTQQVKKIYATDAH